MNSFQDRVNAKMPAAIVYSFFVEYYVTGLTGSVKG